MCLQVVLVSLAQAHMEAKILPWLNSTRLLPKIEAAKHSKENKPKKEWNSTQTSSHIP
jgi:hypothetical protein